MRKIFFLFLMLTNLSINAQVEKKSDFSQLKDSIMNKHVWGQESCEALVKFIDIYTNAYKEKNLDSIKKLCRGTEFWYDKLSMNKEVSSREFFREKEDLCYECDDISFNIYCSSIKKLPFKGRTPNEKVDSFFLEFSQDYHKNNTIEREHNFLLIYIYHSNDIEIRVFTSQSKEDSRFWLLGPANF